jgi:hypothetical protein
LNQQLETDLRRVGDYYPALDNNMEGAQSFPFFYCSENLRRESFFLIGNHGAEGDLVDRYAQVDYLLFIHDLAYPAGAAGLVQEIRKIPQVLTSFEIKLDGFREAEYLISGLEINLLEYHKSIKEKQKLAETTEE